MCFWEVFLLRRERLLLHRVCEQGYLDMAKILVEEAKFSVDEEDERA